MKKHVLVVVGICLLAWGFLWESRVHAQGESNVVVVAPIFIPPPPVSTVTNIAASTNSVVQSEVSPPPVAIGLLAWWSFDEGQGTNVADSSGNGHDGTLVGAPPPMWCAGIISNALLFDGTNYVTVPDRPDLTPKDALTLAAWVKASPTTTGVVLDKWGSGPSGSYALSLSNGTPGLELSLDGVYWPLFATTAMTDTNWHYVAGSYDGTQMVVYVDGSTSISGVATGKVDVADGPLLIGEFAGAVDEARIYDRALSSNEVDGLFNEAANAVTISGTGSQNSNSGSSSTNGFGSGPGTLGQGSSGTSSTRPPGQIILYVDSLFGSDNYDGLAGASESGHGPKQTVNAALAAANNQAAVVVAGGTYPNTSFAAPGKGVSFYATGSVIFKP